ncbi:mitogen-activated protein kinase kinase kinase 15-like isoform X2 [Tubulanus polymorphus]|uniref:mitogen-activated protein kinase kinase kinase 15-like isoform X2 n=1 Tax=Tubulanus polymorphus TaxID=672921 RepID=UPI003DA6080A
MKVVSVIDVNCTSNGAKKVAYQDLEKVCTGMKLELERICFEKLDFGETDFLDKFYNADVAVVDISIQVQQASLFYHIGVRESMGMTDNIILYHDTDPDITKVLKLSCSYKDNFIPYKLDSEKNECVVHDPCATAASKSGTLLTHLLKKGLKDIEKDSSVHIKEKFLADLRKARQTHTGEELKRVLHTMKIRLDDPQLLSGDVVVNMLISYRDVQDYDAMVKLVDDLSSLPAEKITNTIAVQHLYAFALNRRNKEGDRDKALSVILYAIELSEKPVPDMLCLCGRIYKDKFVESKYTDKEMRDKAIEWYRKGFEIQPNEYAGINLATLLVISGEELSKSTELQRIGMILNNLIGRKGSLQSLQDYWDIATFFEISVLAENYGKAIQAAECMFKLEPPMWYLKSTVNNIQLITEYRKTKTPEGSINKDKCLFDFWMEFFIEATKELELSGSYFPVLVLEPNKVFMPSNIQINSAGDEQSVMLWHICPDPDDKKPHQWRFTDSQIKNVSLYKRDDRAIFLYVEQNSDDFQIYFSSEAQRQLFFAQVLEMIDEQDAVDLDVDYGSGDIQYEYEYDEKGDRWELGRGTYGRVYAARDVNTQIRIAIKEVPESLLEDVQPLHEEIKLHSRLHHKNIVKYLGSASKNGFFQIFMEQVPGGSLSALLRSMWGPLKDNEATIAYYTAQIIEGLQYLHDNKIVHRDIKGDNVLVNTYSGILKISDFGTSKRLCGINHAAETFAGTLQYMAPEVIDKGARGYGPPADIWSLGCTVVEMATGKPPFVELGIPQAAMFRVGFYKEHPEIPECMSDKAKAFILRCFEPDPDRRATVADLLDDAFVRDFTSKRSKKKKTQTEYNRSISVPYGSLTPTSPEKDFDSPLRSPPILESNPQTPESDCGLDRSRTGSTGSKRGFYLLRKDSERRLTLVQIMTKDEEDILDIWYQFLQRDLNSPSITKVHLKTLLAGFKELIKDQNRQALANAIGTIKEEVEFDMSTLNEVQMSCYVFQETIQVVLKQQNIQPHWVFALDNFLRQAVQSAITILSPELGAHIAGNQRQEEEGSTSGVSTVNSMRSQHTQGQYDREVIHHLQTEIRDLEKENKRLLEHLLESQIAYKELLKSNIEEKTLLTQHMRLTNMNTAAGSDLVEGACAQPKVYNTTQTADEELVKWLKNLNIDEDTIQKFVMEEYDLPTVLEVMTREDLRRMDIRGGPQCRIWRVLEIHRNQNK